MNNDGYDDVIVGARGDSRPNHSGSAYVYLGSTTGPDAATETKLFGSGSKGFFGSAVSAGGDVDADGYDDVLVGSPSSYQSAFAGTAYVFAGTGDTGNEGDLFQHDTGTMVSSDDAGPDDGCRCSASAPGSGALAFCLAFGVVGIRRRRTPGPY